MNIRSKRVEAKAPSFSSLRRSFDRALLALLVSGILFIVILSALLPFEGPEDIVLLIFPANLIAYLVAGLLAWYHRPSNRMGALILLAGVAVFLTGASNTAIPLLMVIGTIGSTLPLALLVHLLLAFPTGKLEGRVERFTVVSAYVTAIILQIPRYLLGLEDPALPIAMLENRELAQIGAVAQATVGGAVLIVTTIILLRRLRYAPATQRRVLVPLYLYGVVTLTVILFSSRLLPALPEWGPEAVGVLQLFMFLGVPIVFALGVLRGGVARTGELEELGAWLGAAGDEKPAIAEALARALGDPTVEVWFWVAQRSMYVNAEGVDVGERQLEDDRRLELVELDGRRVGAISYDTNRVPDPGLARTASRVVAIALDRERLTVALRASRFDLQRSRERLIEAADSERRRIAQDLHDGLQVQLVLLALEAQQLSSSGPATSRPLVERAAALRRGIDDAAAELRELVHSVMPAALSQRGLSAAAEDLVDRMPIPTTLSLGVVDGECTPVVESTAYFVIAEALANAVKHSNAQSIAVSLQLSETSLHIEIRDDGQGGARTNSGSGLLGMAERIDVLGGSMVVASEPGQGTRIKVEVPCG